MGQQYFVVAGDGNEYGPVDVEQLRDWVAQNRVGRRTLLRRQGDDVQMQAGVFSELGHLFPQQVSTGADTAPGSAQRASVAAQPPSQSGVVLNQGALPQGSPLYQAVVLCVVGLVLSMGLVGVPGLLLGVASVLKSTQANAQYQVGDHAKTEALLADARRYTRFGWVALVVGVMFGLALWWLNRR